MAHLQSLSDKELDRLYRRAYDRVCNRLTGGLSLGMDRQTLKIVDPIGANTLELIMAEILRRVVS